MVLPKGNIKEKKFDILNKNLSKQYMLFLLNALNEKPIKNNTKLMKELFFISKNVPSLEKELDFQSDNYGPSSDVVQRYIENLSQENFLKINKNEYQIDSLGKEYLNSFSSNFNIDLDLIEDMKQLFDGLTNDEVLALTYFTYPETTNESLVLNKIISKRKNLALSLYKKNKISLEKASEIAGISVSDFSNLLNKYHIKIVLEL